MSLLHLPAASGPKVIAEWKSKCFELTNLVRDTEQKLNESQSRARSLKLENEQQSKELAAWSERCRILASRASETQAALDEKSRELQRIEQRFGHAPSAANEIARLKRHAHAMQAERDEFKLQAEQARAREADSSHERALLRRALHRVAHGLPPPVAGDDFDTRTLAALAMSPLASAVASAAKNKRAMDGSSIVSAPHNRSHEEVVSISNLLVQIAEHEERNELSEADNKRLTAEVNRLEAAVEEAQELFNEQCALCEAATADATRAQHAESEARDSLALERDRANELESDKKLIAERLASLEMRAAQYVSEAESSSRRETLRALSTALAEKQAAERAAAEAQQHALALAPQAAQAPELLRIVAELRSLKADAENAALQAERRLRDAEHDCAQLRAKHAEMSDQAFSAVRDLDRLKWDFSQSEARCHELELQLDAALTSQREAQAAAELAQERCTEFSDRMLQQAAASEKAAEETANANIRATRAEQALNLVNIDLAALRAELNAAKSKPVSPTPRSSACSCPCICGASSSLAATIVPVSVSAAAPISALALSSRVPFDHESPRALAVTPHANNTRPVLNTSDAAMAPAPLSQLDTPTFLAQSFAADDDSSDSAPETGAIEVTLESSPPSPPLRPVVPVSAPSPALTPSRIPKAPNLPADYQATLQAINNDKSAASMLAASLLQSSSQLSSGAKSLLLHMPSTSALLSRSSVSQLSASTASKPLLSEAPSLYQQRRDQQLDRLIAELQHSSQPASLSASRSAPMQSPSALSASQNRPTNFASSSTATVSSIPSAVAPAPTPVIPQTSAAPAQALSRSGLKASGQPMTLMELSALDGDLLMEDLDDY